MQHNLIVILGPTACGKTKLAAQLAYALKSVVISADSRQVYKRMNIGTGKDYHDYLVNNHPIPYYLIDIIEPGEQYNLHQFRTDFYALFNQLQTQNITPILCGGTGLYIDSVLRNLTYAGVPNNYALRTEISNKTHVELVVYFNKMPQTNFTNKADLSTQKRTIRAIEINHYLINNNFKTSIEPIIKPIIIGLDIDKEIRKERITNRLNYRLQNGLIEEVNNLLNEGITHPQLQYYGLEYKFVSQHLLGLMSEDALQELLNIAIHQFSKRQMTYFRKMEKDGQVINWIDATQDTAQQLMQVLNILHD